jgi:hypothetical protein
MDLDFDSMTPRKLSFGMDLGKENKLRKRLLLTSSNQSQMLINPSETQNSSNPPQPKQNNRPT